MIPVLIDTSVFSVPPYANDAAEVESLVERVLYWAGLLKGGSPAKLYRKTDADEILNICSAWPIERDIRALLTMFGLDEVFSPRDVLGQYIEIFSRALIWSDEFSDVSDCSDIDIFPDVLAGHTPYEMVEHTKLIFASSSLYASFHDSNRGLILSGLPTPIVGPITFQGLVRSVQGTRKTGVVTPLSLDSKFYLLKRLEDAAVDDGAFSFWSKAESPGDFYLALALGCVSLAATRGGVITFKDIRPFTIGSEFISTLYENDCGPHQKYSAITFQGCCRVLLGIDMNRLNKMGRPHQIVRDHDKATAWRIKLLQKHQALRLMVWKSDGITELANVGAKKEIEIRVGRISEAYSHSW